MKAKLKAHRHPDYPDWIVVKEDVPIGTEYDVQGYFSGVIMAELATGREIILDCYFCIGNGSAGLLPACILEVTLD